jgi:hypothetical protein
MTLCTYREAGRRCIRQAPHDPWGHITVPPPPAPVCSLCDSRCDGSAEVHEQLASGYLGKCSDCSCPSFQVEEDDDRP